MCTFPLHSDTVPEGGAASRMCPSEEAGEKHKLEQQPNHRIKPRSRSFTAQTYPAQTLLDGSPSSLQLVALQAAQFMKLIKKVMSTFHFANDINSYFSMHFGIHTLATKEPF